jgi:hypothetical protein
MLCMAGMLAGLGALFSKPAVAAAGVTAGGGILQSVIDRGDDEEPARPENRRLDSFRNAVLDAMEARQRSMVALANSAFEWSRIIR